MCIRDRNMNDVMKEMFLSDGMPEEIAEMMIREVPPEQTLWTVSYTHLDVYKRQGEHTGEYKGKSVCHTGP